MDKLWWIESCNSNHRFVSLFNGARGPYRLDKKEAEEDGRKHHNAICFFYKKDGLIILSEEEKAERKTRKGNLPEAPPRETTRG